MTWCRHVIREGRVAPPCPFLNLLRRRKLIVAESAVFIRRSEWEIRAWDQECAQGRRRGWVQVSGVLGAGIHARTGVHGW